MTPELTKMVALAKRDGYTHIASIVKSHYASTYWHVVAIDDIARLGYWPKCPTANGHAQGVYFNHVDWRRTVTRQTLRSILREEEDNDKE